MELIRQALISVSDKTGLVEFAQYLVGRLDFRIVSTGGTARELLSHGIPVTEVSVLTGMRECMDGRLKTLHPGIMAGILARSTLGDLEVMSKNGWLPFDMIVVNLYPFQQTINQPAVTLEQAIEMIDIDGPTMLRAAAKNFSRVIPVVDPGDYELVLKELMESGMISPRLRLRLAAKVFEATAFYDKVIASFLRQQLADDATWR